MRLVYSYLNVFKWLFPRHYWCMSMGLMYFHYCIIILVGYFQDIKSHFIFDHFNATSSATKCHIICHLNWVSDSVGWSSFSHSILWKTTTWSPRKKFNFEFHNIIRLWIKVELEVDLRKILISNSNSTPTLLRLQLDPTFDSNSIRHSTPIPTRTFVLLFKFIVYLSK